MRVLVTGSESGLGREICEVLHAQSLKHGHTVYGYDRSEGCDVCDPDADYFSAIELNDGPLDVLINCAAVNKINWIEDVSPDEWDEVMDTNVKGMFLNDASRPATTRLDERYNQENIVSNAAHMPMTCSSAYNASKGAALILTKQMARELTKKYKITVFSISPNKLYGTAMSDDIDRQVVATRGWTAGEAHEYQLQGLLTGKETSPVKLAEFIAYLLQSKENHEMFSGCDIPYGA